MDFSWSKEQVELREKAKIFSEENLNQDISKKDRNNLFPQEEWRKCAEFGVLGWPFKKEYGGGGFDPLTTVLMLEGLGYGSKDNGLPFSLNSQIWSTQVAIDAFGTEEQKQKYLTKLIAGTIG
uniref:acyl-CoA dehydrogenase family protein n=1 Tax=Algoriphagus sp. TaxID=1872435 RepID=UPI0025F0C599